MPRTAGGHQPSSSTQQLPTPPSPSFRPVCPHPPTDLAHQFSPPLHRFLCFTASENLPLKPSLSLTSLHRKQNEQNTASARRQTVSYDLRRQGPNRFGGCFLSGTERFGPDTPFGFHRASTPSGMGPGAGERSNGGDVAGPVERYDLVSSRQQPPAGEWRKGGRRCVGGWCAGGDESETRGS